MVDVLDRPRNVRAWPESGHGVGFASSAAVDFAASWFEHRREANLWNTNGKALVRTQGVDGDVWVDPATGEVAYDTNGDPIQRPQQQTYGVHSLTGEPVHYQPHLTGPGSWVNDHGQLVDRDLVHGVTSDEKLSGPIDYSLVITPGTVGLRAHDPRDSSDPAFDWVEVDEEGNVIKPPATRGQIREFTRSSRQNMIYRCLSIPWGEYIQPDERLWFVTLTAPADWRPWLGNHDQGTKAIKRFADRLAYATDRPARFFWKREFQKRGAPHWHLVLLAPFTIDNEQLRLWISRNWFEAVGSGEQKHLAAGTNIDLERSVGSPDALRLALYFAGYSTAKDKEDQHDIPLDYESPTTGTTGQWWGAKGLKPKEVAVRLTPDEFVKVKRLLRARNRSQTGTSAAGQKVPLTKETTVARVRRPLDRTGERPEHGPDRPPKYRTVRRRRRVRSFAGISAGCTAFVNDGPQLAVAVARVLAEPTTWPKGQPRPLP